MTGCEIRPGRAAVSQLVGAWRPWRRGRGEKAGAVGALPFRRGSLGVPARGIGVALLAVDWVLTLWSGCIYFADYFGESSAMPAPATPETRDAAWIE